MLPLCAASPVQWRPKQLVTIRVITCLVSLAMAAWGQKADLILFNGHIVTVDSQFRIADSLAVSGDRILGVGTQADVNRFADSRTRRIDLKGKTVLPGLMDSHVHSTDA